MTGDPPTSDDALTLRLVHPQWQGAGRDTVAALLPEAPLDEARRAYAVGSRVLDAVLPPHAGPGETVPVSLEDPGEGSSGGIESRSAILASLQSAQEVLRRHDPRRVLTLGGDCSVSVAPFTFLAARYGSDLAVVWIDSHPDVDTPETGYDGYHAMALTAITGHGDEEVLGRLPATVDPARVAIAGVHDWTEDAWPNVAAWGISPFGPEALRETSAPLLDWLAATGATRVAVHLDVDTIDSDEAALGLGRVPGGLTRAQTRRLVADIAAQAEVVALTIAEFIPRDVLALQGLVRGLPLTGG